MLSDVVMSPSLMFLIYEHGHVHSSYWQTDSSQQYIYALRFRTINEKILKAKAETTNNGRRRGQRTENESSTIVRRKTIVDDDMCATEHNENLHSESTASTFYVTRISRSTC